MYKMAPISFAVFSAGCAFFCFLLADIAGLSWPTILCWVSSALTGFMTTFLMRERILKTAAGKLASFHDVMVQVGTWVAVLPFMLLVLAVSNDVVTLSLAVSIAALFTPGFTLGSFIVVHLPEPKRFSA